MAHLSPRTSFAFSVEMQLGVRMTKHDVPWWLPGFRPDVAQQVDHHYRAMQPRVTQRQPAQRTHLLLELGGYAGVDRIVAAVVWTRGNFVDQEALRHDKEFHRQYSNVVEDLPQAHVVLCCIIREAIFDSGGHHADV